MRIQILWPTDFFISSQATINIFKDPPIVLSIIKDLGAILNTVSTA